jgi:hypothetical protein
MDLAIAYSSLWLLRSGNDMDAGRKYIRWLYLVQHWVVVLYIDKTACVNKINTT